ncbi:MAG: S8 family serine peptidase [Candidatus Zixiibacteriota bacterium]|nr:MAG: S8 family serine peptidase [candidate division Zixibacteria bacterium]
MKKKRLAFLIWLVLTGAFLLHPEAAHCIYSASGESALPEFAPDRLIIKLKSEADERISLQKVRGKVVTGLAPLDTLHQKFKVKEQEKLFKEFRLTALRSEKFSSVYLLQVPDGTDLIKMKSEYEARPEVEYAELDHRFQLFEEPDDPLFPHQWYLNNTGQGYLGVNRIAGHRNDTQVVKYGTVDADVDALEAFEADDETTIPLVGIIDTGVDLDHVDLADNTWVNPGEDLNGDGVIAPLEINGIDDDHNGFVDDFYGWDYSGYLDSIYVIQDNDPTDYYGHGTHCAGIVAAVRGNGSGVSGITTPCRIMAIKIFPYALFSLSAKGIVYASDNGCDLINISWGSPFPSKLIEDALDYAIEKGVLPIAAAGNSGAEDYFYPASLPQVFTVGASNSDDEVTHFSTYGEQIEVVAPGEDILSLRADTTDMYADGGASGIEPLVHVVDSLYYIADGTSMAAPCAVGVAAYILAASPGLTGQRVREIIEQSADDFIFPYGGDSLYSPGEDIYSGHGRVNLNSALQLLSGRLAKIDYPYENAIVSGEVAILGTAAGAGFENYLLEYGQGYSPEEWTEIVSSESPVSKDTLGIWTSEGLTGLYTVRLTVGDENQTVVHVRVANDVYVRITSPSDGDTIVRHTQVWGSAVAPDFSHYVLEYGFGESPSFWIPTDTSTKMVADHILGDWLVSYLQEAQYALRLTVQTTAGQAYADTVVVRIKGLASGDWFVELSNPASLSPGVGDVDGDGYDEIVVGIGTLGGRGSGGGIEVFTHQGQREPGWPRDTDKSMISSPALGDLDGDGIDDIVICCKEDGVRAYLSSSPDWVGGASVGGNDLWSLATPVIADLENDGLREVLIINDQGTVYAWRSNGESVIPGKDGLFAMTVSSSITGFPCVAVADLDRDGTNEVVGAIASYGPSATRGGIYIWSTEGVLLLGPGNYLDEFSCLYGIAIANIDESEDLEIITLGAGTSDITLSAFKKDGSQVTDYPIVLTGLSRDLWFGNHPAIADLEMDGVLEIVVSVWAPGEGRVYGWHQDGTPLGSFGSSGLLVSVKSDDVDRKRMALGTLGTNIGEIATQIKRMGQPELASLLSPGVDPVFASVAESFGSPVLADVDGDGNLDILARSGYFSGGGYQRLFAWDYEGNPTPGFPLYACLEASSNSYPPYAPLVADMDRNGKLNVVLCSAQPNRYQLFCWELESAHDISTTRWPKCMHDGWNSSTHGFWPPGSEIVNTPPRNLHVIGWSDTSLMLAWTPKPPWTSTGYNIYRAEESGQPGVQINPHLIAQPDSEYQDVGLILEQDYYYSITNVSADHEESDRSPELRIAFGQPSAPAGLQTQVEDGVVTLAWTPNPVEENVSKYMIYLKTPNHTEFQLVDSVTADTTYVDSSPKWAGTHNYRIAAVNLMGLESFPSEAVQVDIPLVGPSPQDLAVSSWNGTNVTLTWRVTQEGEGCNIYRTAVPGIFRDPPLNVLPILDPIGVVITYWDGYLGEGSTYYYVVTQLREGKESSPSDQIEFLAGRPKAPTGLTGEIRECHIVVQWNTNSERDVTGYRIYHRVPPGDDYVLIDSVEHDTVYVDPATDDSLQHYYLVTAVDSLGLESFLPSFPPTSPVFVEGPLHPPDPPSEFKILHHTNSSITFKMSAPEGGAFNIYRSTTRGEYHDPPINPDPIPNVHPREYLYLSDALIEGQEYFFNVTCIRQNECGTPESKMDSSTELSLVLGQPEGVADLSAELEHGCEVLICWRANPEGDIVKYMIYRAIASPDSDFHLLDSVFAPETTYVDANISDTLFHGYAVTAVDSLGLEGPMPLAAAWVNAGVPASPDGIMALGSTDSSVNLIGATHLRNLNGVIGCNFYRTLTSGDYGNLRPRNDSPVPYDSNGTSSFREANYTDFDLAEGVRYYYTVTNVSTCGLESDPVYNGRRVEESVLVGRPDSPVVKVRSGKENIRVYISSSDTDIEGYKILRKEDDGAFELMDALYPDTVYTDTGAIAGVGYHYKVAAIDTFSLEGDTSSEVEGCLMLLDEGMLLVDMTRGMDIMDGVRGDSVNAFYERALEGYDYSHVRYDDWSSPLKLLELSSHPIAIVHCLDEPLSYHALSGTVYDVLEQYLSAGGALLIEGRRNLPKEGWDWLNPEFSIYFGPGDLGHDYFGLDSAYIPLDWQPGGKAHEFIGAERTSHLEGYPYVVELDTFKVNHAYDPYSYALDGRLPGVGYFWPSDTSEVMYTFTSVYDSSASNGKPVALKHFTEDFALIYFDFPLYFVQESIATRILRQAISDLEEFAERPRGPVVTTWDLAEASVFPNPFRPYDGHTHMTFDGLTAYARIEIFTIAGERVCTLEETDGDGMMSWDVTNSQGKKLASGVYIYRVTDNQGHERISKFAVIR